MKLLSAPPVRLPGMASRLTKVRIVAELPISRHSSIERINAFMSAEPESVLATISIGSDGFGPVIRRCPWLSGRTPTANINHEAAVGRNWAVPPVENGTSAGLGGKSGRSGEE